MKRYKSGAQKRKEHRSAMEIQNQQRGAIFKYLKSERALDGKYIFYYDCMQYKIIIF